MAFLGNIAKALLPIVIEKVIDKVVKKEEGGAVKKTQLAQIHAGEYVLPKGVKPTPAQRRAVAKNKITKQKARAKAPKRTQVRKPQIRKPTNQLVKKKRKGKK
jgi:hypothetical protein